MSEEYTILTNTWNNKFSFFDLFLWLIFIIIILFSPMLLLYINTIS